MRLTAVLRAPPTKPKYFRPSPTKDFAKQLGNLFGAYRTRTRARGANKYLNTGLRHNVVSEKLCDDAIKYLAPTLEQYKGCTIIDVNPGSCLWSSKIHDFLKPKRHVLMEPDERYVEPFIKPLLDKPDSNYRHTTLNGAHDWEYWGNYDTILADPNLIPPRTSEDKVQLRCLDTNLLVIGNLARTSKMRKGQSGRNKYASTIIGHMATGALENSLFHKNGLVRMLWWVPEEEKVQMIALTEFWKSAYNSGLNLAASVTEAVGTIPLRKQRLSTVSIRPPFMEMISDRRVRLSMKKLGIKPLESRPYNVVKLPRPEERVRFVSPLKSTVNTVTDLKVSIAWTESRLKRMEQWPTRGKQKIPAPELKWGMATLEFPQCIDCASYHYESKAIAGKPDRLSLLLDLCLRIVRLEVNLKVIGKVMKNRKHLKPLESRIRALDKKAWEVIGERGEQYKNFIEMQLNEQVSFFSSPPTLPRDGRPYEPLHAQPTEFWPAQNVALLDMTPVGRELSVPGLATPSEAIKVARELLKHMFSSRKASIPAALDRIAPNAAQDLIPQAPSITDARKGGRLNPNHVLVNMLTEEMVTELTKAFIEWPFKPDLIKLAIEKEVDADVVDGAEEEIGKEEEI